MQKPGSPKLEAMRRSAPLRPRAWRSAVAQSLQARVWARSRRRCASLSVSCSIRRAGGVAAEHVFELLAHSPPGAEEQRLDRRLADRERGRDLGVGAAFELAQDERLALLRRQLGERGAERLGATALRLLDRHLLELDLDRPPRTRREGAAALVVGDLDQPVARLLHLLAAGEGTEGPDEGRLDDVLGVRAGAQDQQDVPQNLVRVASIQPVDLGRGVSAPETEDLASPAMTTIALGETP